MVKIDANVNLGYLTQLLKTQTKGSIMKLTQELLGTLHALIKCEGKITVNLPTLNRAIVFAYTIEEEGGSFERQSRVTIKTAGLEPKETYTFLLYRNRKGQWLRVMNSSHFEPNDAMIRIVSGDIEQIMITLIDLHYNRISPDLSDSSIREHESTTSDAVSLRSLVAPDIKE